MLPQIAIQEVIQQFPVLPGPVMISDLMVTSYRGLPVTEKSSRPLSYWFRRDASDSTYGTYYYLVSEKIGYREILQTPSEVPAAQPTEADRRSEGINWEARPAIALQNWLQIVHFLSGDNKIDTSPPSRSWHSSDRSASRENRNLLIPPQPLIP